MSGVPVLLGVFDVSECKPIKSRQPRGMGIYYRDGDEDGPGDKPNGEEHESHHAEEANEEIGI